MGGFVLVREDKWVSLYGEERWMQSERAGQHGKACARRKQVGRLRKPAHDLFLCTVGVVNFRVEEDSETDSADCVQWCQHRGISRRIPVSFWSAWAWRWHRLARTVERSAEQCWKLKLKNFGEFRSFIEISPYSTRRDRFLHKKSLVTSFKPHTLRCCSCRFPQKLLIFWSKSDTWPLEISWNFQKSNEEIEFQQDVILTKPSSIVQSLGIFLKTQILHKKGLFWNRSHQFYHLSLIISIYFSFKYVQILIKKGLVFPQKSSVSSSKSYNLLDFYIQTQILAS